MLASLLSEASTGRADEASGEIDVIRTTVQRICELKAQRSAINARITEERGRIRSLGIRAVDFAVAYRLWELEVEDRNNAMDNIRRCCTALALGAQGELFPATAATVAAEPTPGTSRRRKRTGGGAAIPHEADAPSGSYADLAGPDSAAAAQRSHTYPRSRFAGAPGPAVAKAFGGLDGNSDDAA
jgi:hypothetical protein